MKKQKTMFDLFQTTLTKDMEPKNPIVRLDIVGVVDAGIVVYPVPNSATLNENPEFNPQPQV
jgi:hypothetical protein